MSIGEQQTNVNRSILSVAAKSTVTIDVIESQLKALNSTIQSIEKPDSGAVLSFELVLSSILTGLEAARKHITADAYKLLQEQISVFKKDHGFINL